MATSGWSLQIFKWMTVYIQETSYKALLCLQALAQYWDTFKVQSSDENRMIKRSQTLKSYTKNFAVRDNDPYKGEAFVSFIFVNVLMYNRGQYTVYTL